MKKQYEAGEKNRALNFQRLLAQEEKRTGDLDAEAKRLKRDVPELEAKNRELAAQLQAVREQAARIKEETTRSGKRRRSRAEKRSNPSEKHAPRLSRSRRLPYLSSLAPKKPKLR